METSGSDQGRRALPLLNPFSNPRLSHPDGTGSPIEQLAEYLPGAMFRVRVMPDGTRRLEHMTRGCFDIWELDPTAVEQDMGSLWGMVDARDLPAMQESIERCARDMRDWDWQWRIQTPSGRVKWLHGVGRPLREPDGTLIWHCYVLDQTNNLQAQENLRESEERFRRLIDTIPSVAVQGYDDQLICRFWNSASEQLYGWTSQQAIGRSLLDLIIPAQMRAAVIEATDQMLATGEAIPSSELILQHRDGSPVAVFSGHVMLQREGRRGEFFCIDFDLRERVHAEQTRQRLEAQLRESQKMEALGTLAGGVAHDFNNIVAAILGNVTLALGDGAREPELMVSLQEIRKAGVRARELVQQILTFSRREDSQRKPTNPQAVLTDAHALLRATLPVDVKLSVNSEAPVPWVLANATQLEQVILNLCGNAIQAVTGRPNGLVKVTLARVDGSLPASMIDETEVLPPDANWPTSSVRLDVEDNGVGIDAATLPRIFEPFFTTKAPGTGTGLGLAVVHGILKDHGAVLRVRSAPGRGTRLSILLPGLAGDFAGTAVAPEPDVQAVAPESIGSRGHVLYVDDDESIALLVKRWLQRHGYRVSTFTDPQAALRALEGSGLDVSLCISDFNMPEMSGIGLARALKAIRPDLPVAIASGYISEELRREAPAAGVDEIIYKPDTVEALCQAIEKMMAGRRL
ncbi:hybrid sensor histidine kinase/response regulator [Hydrogenophaga intermedia]|uniref:hybrid sensor histidine kinase/response regulator n=1 Tax=Hydrogenophaga intermedia TaxID=65786 RepID=UPI0020437E21|nr:PAS domain-containing sensor histidine kinase [Hydrogenophaga intermedia]MCM3564596.1 response regulator [Hydrogenophaga intermedia]